MNEKDEELNFKLLANPFHLKKDMDMEVEYDYDEDLILKLKNKFPGTILKEEDYSSIFLKIEKILHTITITNIIDRIISEIEKDNESYGGISRDEDNNTMIQLE